MEVRPDRYEELTCREVMSGSGVVGVSLGSDYKNERSDVENGTKNPLCEYMQTRL